MSYSLCYKKNYKQLHFTFLFYFSYLHSSPFRAQLFSPQALSFKLYSNTRAAEDILDAAAHLPSSSARHNSLLFQQRGAQLESFFRGGARLHQTAAPRTEPRFLKLHERCIMGIIVHKVEQMTSTMLKKLQCSDNIHSCIGIFICFVYSAEHVRVTPVQLAKF